MTVDVEDAQREFARLVEAASQGVEIAIAVNGTVKARLTRVVDDSLNQEPGSEHQSKK